MAVGLATVYTFVLLEVMKGFSGCVGSGHNLSRIDASGGTISPIVTASNIADLREPVFKQQTRGRVKY